MRRILAAAVAACLLAGLVVAAVGVTPKKAVATPIATDAITYMANGRVYPDPQGCSNGAPGTSPFAKGITCAVDFIQHEEMTGGLMFLQETFPKMTRFYRLGRHFRCNGKPAPTPQKGCKEFLSAGLPVSDDTTSPDAPISRDRRRLHMFRVTDETAPMPLKKRKWYVFPLSIHGIERAGVEGGLRAVEDLATWGACENLPAGQIPDYVDCEGEVTGSDAKPYPLLEATPGKSLSAGDALKRAVVVVVMPNPDGWVRGDRMRDSGEPSSSFYQRYNGNGVDLNRDWPTLGWTFRPYTPASEPESKAFGKVLRQLGPKDRDGDPKWDGGIDLHGQLIDRAFSFTLLGAGEFDYAENQAILQTTKGAWRDAEKRLGWSTIIKPNDAPQDDPRLYGVQWGTVWDTIDYTITGGFGDWIGSPLGLGAKVPIDNEMSLSHLSTCGTGSCYVPEFEQLHVDGNKSLMYAMVNYGLKKENKTFRTKGRVAYVHNRGVVKEKTNLTERPPRFARLDPQEDIEGELLTETNGYEYQFGVKGPKDGVYNGGIEAKLTCLTSDVSPGCELTDAVLERKLKKKEERPPECDPDPSVECWEVVNTYFLQGAGYSATGKALHANLPTAGRWRVRLEGADLSGGFELDINFTREKAWNDPGQIGFRATSMKFWRHLRKFARPGLDKLTVGEIQNTNKWKRRYDTIAITNRVYKQVAGELKQWVAQQDGNLVLTDKAVKMLDTMGLVNGGVKSVKMYAGYMNFETYEDPGEDESGSYDDDSGLAKNVNQPGSAEGGQEESDEIEGQENHRHQTYEPVPLGIAIEDAGGSDWFNSPVWYVEETSLVKAKGKPNAVGTTGEVGEDEDSGNVSLGEIKYKGGHIRWGGALLPDPTKKFDNPFGVANYAMTYSGYQVLKNMLTYKR